jgi:putative ABC transport system permease protein
MKTNFKIVLRYFLKANSSIILNITGLAIGFSLFALISMLLNYEYTYDGFHPNKDKILQVCSKDLKSGELSGSVGLPLPLTLKNDFPEVKYVTGIWKTLYDNGKIKYQNIEYSGFTGASVEPDFFYIFNYKLILGDIRTALKTPVDIAISQSLSKKIFGSENPIGKTLMLNNYSFTISHLFAEIPNNSSVKFDILFSDKIREYITSDYKKAWWNSGISTYVLLKDNCSVENFNRNLKTIPGKYYPDFLKGRSTFFTIPFTKSHYSTSLVNNQQPAVSYTFLFVLGTISFIILLIACINYINLTLARAFKLNVDAGIRRIVGAGSNHIISIQFWYASISVFIALILSIPISRICLPVFEKLAERPLAGQVNNINVWILTLSASVIVTIISGFIPGKIFSKVNPAKIIKSKGALIKTYKGVHNGLLVFQFALTIVLIISQFFILKQIYFMKNADLGYDNNNLVSVNLNNINAGYAEKYQKSKLYKEELIRLGTQYGLTTGTITENVPGFYYQNSFTVNPVDAEIDECLVISTAVGENYPEVFKSDIIKGRFFSEQYKTDRNSFIINETAMKKFGWKDVEGKFIKLSHEGDICPVVGVMKDIHLTTLKEPISPMVYRYGQHNNFPAFLTFRIKPGLENKAIAFMKKTWVTIFPEDPFYSFNVKETYYKNYEEEQRLSKIVGIFALLAVVLSLFGLIGLTMYYSEGRTKEIGIRKVNGAKVTEVIAMLNINFIQWVIIAFILACPIAWYVMNKWLQNFAYKTPLSWWVFVAAGIVSVGVALITISLQSYKAATRNPVEALRYE